MTLVLCLTQITSWGVLFYAFPVLAPSIARETGWSPPQVVAAFTAGQLVAAGAGLLVGRSVQARGPRAVMTLGSAVAVAALVAVATAGSWATFLVAWLAVGAAMAATLYPPAFAALTVWGGAERVRALTVLTLVGGLASTVFAPLSAILDGHLGWRGTYLVLAVVLTLTVPLHWWGLAGPWQPLDGAARGWRPTQVWRTRPFLALVAAKCLVVFCIAAVVVLQVPLLLERGYTSEVAALVLGTSGVGQVCGRLLYGRLARRVTVDPRTMLVFGAVAATTLLFGIVPGPLGALFVLSFLVGGARGIHTLVQATAVADRWGTAHFASLNAVAMLPVTVVAAVSPWVATTVAVRLDSHATTFLLLAAVAATGVPAVRAGRRRTPQSPRTRRR